MTSETWLTSRLDHLRALKSLSVTQKLLIQLADKTNLTKQEQRELDALVRLEKINDRAALAKVKAHKIIREKSEGDRKARNHRLIMQGALIDLVGLESIDRGILVGGLLQFADQLKDQEFKLEPILKARGDALLATKL